MESFTIVLVSNASAQLFPDKTLSSFTNFLAEHLNLDGQWEVANSEISYPPMYQIVTEGKFMFFVKKLAKSLEFYYLQHGLYPSIKYSDEKHSHSRKTQSQRKLYQSYSVSKNAKNLDLPCK